MKKLLIALGILALTVPAYSRVLDLWVGDGTGVPDTYDQDTGDSYFEACMELDGADYGLEPAPVESVRGGDAEENARITREILAGERGPRRDIVLLNAGTALHAAGTTGHIQEGIALAADAIDSGRAGQVLESLIAFSQTAP